MSYTPTEWKAGDTVTSAKLNKMEQGIADNNVTPLFIYGNTSGSLETLNKTWKEIYDAMITQGRQVIYIHSPADSFALYCPCIGMKKESDSYRVYFGLDRDYSTDDENGYPHYSWD